MISSTVAVIQSGALKSGDAKSQAAKKLREQLGGLGTLADNADNVFLYTDLIKRQEQALAGGGDHIIMK